MEYGATIFTFKFCRSQNKIFIYHITIINYKLITKTVINKINKVIELISDITGLYFSHGALACKIWNTSDPEHYSSVVSPHCPGS
jgi:hypothetical protein